MRRLFVATSVSLAALCWVHAAPVFAQNVPEADTAEPQADDTEEQSGGAIIITATRRASPLSDVPIAVSAITSQALQNSGANDIRQLNQLAPSLLIVSTGTEANGVARIRGIGTVGDNPGLESSVAVFIDGVYRSRPGAAMTDLGDVERIEVLRGPQGTLFGRNSSAGLINIVSKSPSFKFGASGELTYGNYDYWHASARVTGPITDTVAASLEGVWSKRDGFLKMVNAAGAQVGDTNDRDRYFLRGQLLFEPTSDLSIRLIGDYTRHDESCCGAVYVDVGEETGTNPSGFTPSATNRLVSLLSALGTRFPNGPTPYTQDPYQRQISITPGREYGSKLKDWGVSGQIDYDFGGAKLSSITAYRNYRSADFGDYDYATADLLYRDPNTYRQFKTFTQELRLQGSAFDNRLDWLVGGYYAHEDLTLRDNIRFGADYGRFAACRLMQGTGNTSNFSAAQLSLCAVPIDGNAATPDIGNLIAGTRANLNTALTPVVGATQAGIISTGLAGGLTALANLPSGAGDTDTRYFQKSANWAVFTHDIVHITDALDLTLGLRYTHESKDVRLAMQNNNATCAALQATSLPTLATTQPLASATPGQLAGGILTLACLGNSSTGLNNLTPTDSRSGGQLSGTAVLSYKVNPSTLVYASYARGYKAGGFNLDRFELGSTGVAPALAPLTYFSPRTNADATALWFEPETVNAFELGLKLNKSKWGVNLALFYQQFTNFQLNTFNGTSFVVQNINGCKSTKAANGTCTDTKAGLVSQGVEIEAYVSPARNVRIATGVTYAKTDFTKQLVGNGDGTIPLDPALLLLEGNTNSNAPRWVVTSSFSWTPSVGSNGMSALFYIDQRSSSSYNTGSDLYPEKAQQGFTVSNARIGLRGRNESWAIEFWGQNIFNEKYTQVVFNSPLQSSGPNNQSYSQLGRSGATMSNQLFSAYMAEPRTYGITLRGKF